MDKREAGKNGIWTKKKKTEFEKKPKWILGPYIPRGTINPGVQQDTGETHEGQSTRRETQERNKTQGNTRQESQNNNQELEMQNNTSEMLIYTKHKPQKTSESSVSHSLMISKKPRLPPTKIIIQQFPSSRNDLLHTLVLPQDAFWELKAKISLSPQ